MPSLMTQDVSFEIFYSSSLSLCVASVNASEENSTNARIHRLLRGQGTTLCMLLFDQCSMLEQEARSPEAYLLLIIQYIETLKY